MNLYVSNLSYQTSDEDLKQLFGQFGTVSSAKVIADRETGQSRGFGFVEMNDEDEGKKALEGLNSSELNGRSMNVAIAREKQPRSDNRKW